MNKTVLYGFLAVMSFGFVGVQAATTEITPYEARIAAANRLLSRHDIEKELGQYFPFPAISKEEAGVWQAKYSDDENRDDLMATIYTDKFRVLVEKVYDFLIRKSDPRFPKEQHAGNATKIVGNFFVSRGYPDNVISAPSDIIVSLYLVDNFTWASLDYLQRNDLYRKVYEQQKTKTCPVCFEEFSVGETKKILLPCTHPLCRGCLKKIAEGPDFSYKCPLCRAEHSCVDLKEVLRFAHEIQQTVQEELACKAIMAAGVIAAGFSAFCWINWS